MKRIGLGSLRNKGRRASLFLVLSLMLSLTTSACAADTIPAPEVTASSLTLAAATGDYTDVPNGAWYADAVAYLSDNGIMTGTGNARFSPDDSFTRAQLATVLYRIAGEPGVSGEDSFTDTEPGAWYAPAVLWAQQQGVVNGVGNGLFGTSNPVTQEQMATMLWRMKGEPESTGAADASAYAANAVGWARASGIAPATADYTFAPKDDATRAQVAGLVYNYLRHGDISPHISGKTLVACFSATGSTMPLAEYAADILDADLYEIVPEIPYTAADIAYYTDCRADREQSDPDARPALGGKALDVSLYDTVVIGHPIWHGQAPKIIYTFLESYDFSGKTLVTFCTSHSSPVGSSAENLKKLTPGSTWLESRRFPAGASKNDIRNWLDEIGLGADREETEVGVFDFENKSVLLNSGYQMPIMGLGTYSLDHNTCVNSVKALLKNGGRLIDTAYMYHNEEAVGEGIRQAMEEYGISREEIFVITKIYPNQFNDPEPAIEMALEKLDIDYIDMMLLHHPGTNDVKAYQAMERYVESGKIRSLGLSNWYVKELTEFLPQVTIPPALVQNEIHPYYQEQDVVPFIQEHGIVVQCWYPLGGRGYTAELLADGTITAIADAHGVSSAQVILRWDLQRGIVVIPGSGNPEHIEENLDLFSFALTDEEMAAINSLDRGEKHDWY